MFEKIEWHPDRALLNSLVFRLEHFKNDNWEKGKQCFLFYKIKQLVDQYEQAFRRRPGWHPGHILELGMWDRGGLAFWNEILQPEILIGLDITERENSEYFKQYVTSRHLSDRIKTYWNTNQTDRKALCRILEEDFDGYLDLVIDDCSHLYNPTKASFECLFPMMPDGGVYIIEDWAWAHWKEYQAPDHPWASEKPLTLLIDELIEAVGTSNELIRSVEVYQGFAIIERGQLPVSELTDFRLEDHIIRRHLKNSDQK